MLSSPKTCHIYDVKQSLRNHVHVDLPSQINPIIAKQTDDLYNVWQCLVENLVILKSAKTIRKQIANEAMKTPRLVHLLLDQIQHHLDLKREAMCEIDLPQT